MDSQEVWPPGIHRTVSPSPDYQCCTLINNNTLKKLWTWILQEGVQVLAYSGVSHLWIQLRPFHPARWINIKICLVSFYKCRVYKNHNHILWIRSFCNTERSLSCKYIRTKWNRKKCWVWTKLIQRYEVLIKNWWLEGKIGLLIVYHQWKISRQTKNKKWVIYENICSKYTQ